MPLGSHLYCRNGLIFCTNWTPCGNIAVIFTKNFLSHSCIFCMQCTHLRLSLKPCWSFTAPYFFYTIWIWLLNIFRSPISWGLLILWPTDGVKKNYLEWCRIARANLWLHRPNAHRKHFSFDIQIFWPPVWTVCII